MARLERITCLVASILLISSCAGYKEASPDDDWRPAYLGPIKCQTTAAFYHIIKPKLETRRARDRER